MNNYTYMTDRDFSHGRKYIGASDMGTLTLLTKQYKTPLMLWEELTGRREPFGGNTYTEWGHEQEPLILGKWIEKYTGSREKKNEFITSRMYGDTDYLNCRSWTEAIFPGNPRVVAHADLLVLGDYPAIVQAKNTGTFAANQRKRDPNKGYDRYDHSQNGIPLSVYYQEQYELMCYGVSEAYVVVLIDGNSWHEYGPIVPNKTIQEQLLALAERMLWHVDNDVPPRPETWDDVVRLSPDIEKEKVSIVDGEDEIKCREMLVRHGKLSERKKQIESELDDIKNALGIYLGGCGVLETSSGEKIASATDIKGRESISVTDLKQNQELYTAVTDAGLIRQSDGYRNLYIAGVPAGNVTRYTLIQEGKKSRKKYTHEEKKLLDEYLKKTDGNYEWEEHTK